MTWTSKAPEEPPLISTCLQRAELDAGWGALRLRLLRFTGCWCISHHRTPCLNQKGLHLLQFIEVRVWQVLMGEAWGAVRQHTEEGFNPERELAGSPGEVIHSSGES